MKNANADSCACRSLSVKMPFNAATSGSISEVMKPHAKNSVVTAAKAARTVGLLIRSRPAALAASCANLPSSARHGNRHVVDKARPADPRGDEQAGRAFAELRQRLKARRIGQIGIDDARKSRREEPAPKPRKRFRHLAAILDRADRLAHQS